LWYGSNKQNIFKKNFSQNKIRDNKCQNLTSYSVKRPKSLYYFYKIISFPVFWKCIILRALLLIQQQPICLFLSTTYYLKFILPTQPLFFSADYSTPSISFTLNYRAESVKLFYQKFNQVMRLFYLPLFLKLKFKGKGYYVYKNKRNTITPQFGFSHRNYVYSSSINVKFLSKTKIFLFGLSKIDILQTAYTFKQLKSINIFTGRGVRFAKQVIYRKTGKISSYR
jgi:hypothetical protein